MVSLARGTSEQAKIASEVGWPAPEQGRADWYPREPKVRLRKTRYFLWCPSAKAFRKLPE